MNARQEKFCLEYAACGNASEAARRAGYKGDPNTVGPRLLAYVGVKARIKELHDKEQAGKIATAQECKEFWSTVMRSSDADMRDRLKAAELLGKAGGMFLERHEVTGAGLVLRLPNKAKE